MGLSIAFGNTTRNPNSNWNNARPTPQRSEQTSFSEKYVYKGSKKATAKGIPINKAAG